MNYLLKFKANPAIDDVFVTCGTNELAVTEIIENVNELEWALLLTGIPGSINSEDVTRKLIGAVNARLEADENGADELQPWDWSPYKIRRHYEVM